MTVATITAVSLRGIRFRVLMLMLCQSNVATDTMIITATQSGHGDEPHQVAKADDEDQEEDARQEWGDSRAGAGCLHVDHRLADHGAPAHSTEQMAVI